MAYALLQLRKNEVESEPVTEINIIPVIDISLVLLVILFVTAPLLSYPNLPIDLPRSSAKETREPSVTITYTKDGRLSVAARESGWDDLEEKIVSELKRNPNATVVLRVDRVVPYRIVQRLIMASKKAGGAKVALATESYK